MATAKVGNAKSDWAGLLFDGTTPPAEGAVLKLSTKVVGKQNHCSIATSDADKGIGVYVPEHGLVERPGGPNGQPIKPMNRGVGPILVVGAVSVGTRLRVGGFASGAAVPIGAYDADYGIATALEVGTGTEEAPLLVQAKYGFWNT